MDKIKELEEVIEDKRLDIKMLFTDAEWKEYEEGTLQANFVDRLFDRLRDFIRETTDLEVLKAELRVRKEFSHKTNKEKKQ